MKTNAESQNEIRQNAAGSRERPSTAVQRKLDENIQSSPRILQQKALIAEMQGHGIEAAVQRFTEEEEKPVQGRFASPIQRIGEEEEKPLQGRFASPVQRVGEEEEKTLQGRFASPIQRVGEEEEKPLQGRFKGSAGAIQRVEAAPSSNRTGLPDSLKSGVENLSGMSLDSVKVHYNSDKPAQLNALAYTQGSEIHVAPGQEQHLPHEAWHVVQQAQGRVQPTMQMMEGVPVNDDAGLEHEADAMGAKAVGK